MGVVALALGILGVLVFSWLGPVLGGVWAGGVSVSQSEAVTWPLWVLGIGLGTVPALVAVGLGIAALKSEPKKGVALAGLVTGAIGALGGLIITVALVFFVNAGEAIVESSGEALEQEMKKPVQQQGLKQLMEQSKQTSDE